MFIYLANDVVQNGKKKGGEFTKEFSTVIHNAFIHVMDTAEDEKTKKALARVLSVWAERCVFHSHLLLKMKTTLSGRLSSRKIVIIILLYLSCWLKPSPGNRHSLLTLVISLCSDVISPSLHVFLFFYCLSLVAFLRVSCSICYLTFLLSALPISM